MTSEANCWAQIDAMKKSGDQLLDRLRRRRNGWKMKEAKPDGTMIAERSELRRVVINERTKEPEEVVVRKSAAVSGKTHAEVWEKVVREDGLCPTCFHRLAICGPSGCAAKMPHLPKVIVTVTVRGKAKQRRQVAKCGCTAHVQAAEPAQAST